MKKNKNKEPYDPLRYSAGILPKAFINPGNKDLFGSYSGVAMDPIETPVQDADDL